jgi:hypothetical protein
MDKKFRISILLSLLFLWATVSQLPASAQSLGDSFSSNSNANFSTGSLDNDVFGDDTPASPGLSNAEIAQRVESFAKSLPNEEKAIYGILDHLLRLRVEHWHYPNLSKLSIWMGECQAALHKAAGINDKTEYQNSFHNRTPSEISRTLQEKHQTDDCYNAWLKAYNAVLSYLPHNSGEEQEPHLSQSRAAAQKAIELAESICHFSSPATELLPPNPHQNNPPPLAPQRPGSRPASQSPLVLKGRTATEAHFEQVKEIIGRLPPNIQQFMRNHHVRVVATNKVIDERPDAQGVRPRGWTRYSWESADASYDKSTNRVLAGDKYLVVKTWQHSYRVDSVVRHETGHSIDHNMGDFSHNNPGFIAAYNKEAKTIPDSDESVLNYVLQDGDSGREEAFAEMFADINGRSVAGGPAVQFLIEKYFPDTITVVRNAMRSLR